MWSDEAQPRSDRRSCCVRSVLWWGAVLISHSDAECSLAFVTAEPRRLYQDWRGRMAMSGSSVSLKLLP